MVGDSHTLSELEKKVLRRLAKGPKTIRELAVETNQPMKALWPLLERLVIAGLVEQKWIEEITLFELTEEGKKKLGLILVEKS